ncbi:MAG: class I adenylate-forming enzyme family protein [Acidimicrobiia bacterium]
MNPYNPRQAHGAGWWVDIISSFRRTARRHGSRVFLFDSETSITYAEADVRTEAIAHELMSRGISDGVALGLCASDRVELWLAIMGAWKAGALPSLIDARTSNTDLPYFVGDIAAPLLAAAPELHDRLTAAGAAEVVDLATLEGGDTTRCERHHPQAPLYLSYTSGTTGTPKGAVLHSEPVTLGTALIADRLVLTCADVLLATTPISSSFQLVAAVMPAIHTGASVGLLAGRSIEEIWSSAQAMRASILVAYPLTLAEAVMTSPAVRGRSPFRLALSGGSPLAPRIKRDYRDHLGIHLLESYGQSELGGFMAMGSERDGDRALAGYVGRPLPDRLAYVGGPDGIELPAGEVGEVLVTHGFFAEYRNKPDETVEAKAGGVLHTGDLGVADENGYLKVLGRVREAASAARRGGFLRELEDAYYDHEDVLHATVVENPDGEVEAFLELRPGHSTTAEEVESHAIARAPAGLAPRQTTVLERMPRTFSGKADRRSLALGVGG